MSVEMTAQHLNELGFTLDTSGDVIQRFHWSRGRNQAFRVSLWIATTHPLVRELTPSILPYMDACICWYHDHHALSCLRVRETMRHMEQYTDSIWLMVTTFPRVLTPHASHVPRFYDVNGFERTRLTGDFIESLTYIVKEHVRRNPYSQ